MYDPELRAQAVALLASGQAMRDVSDSLGVPYFTLRYWRENPARPRSCPRCAQPPTLPDPSTDYAYLLGLYLGDGCISVVGDPRKLVWQLRIACADAWPGLLQECARAMQAVLPGNKVGFQQGDGCKYVRASSKHWPCLFPQHGVGRKHTRPIILEPWQQAIVDEFPGPFARGLFHSDGYRGLNRIKHSLPSGDRWYAYPRYLFVNQSADIRAMCGQALDELGVAWRYSKQNTISVARREAVARLDQFVGPKY
ncbi:MAG: transcriptional regulator [Actinobacteria bacterium]|nr:transcriptional regulator [Actinomycetota bacterium]